MKKRLDILEGIEDLRDRTGGQHGDVYTKTFPVEKTPMPAIKEILSRFTKRKLTKTQKRYLLVARQLDAIGVTDSSVLTESLKACAPKTYAQLELFFAVNPLSLASVNNFCLKWNMGTLVGHCQKSSLRYDLATSRRED